MKWRVGINGFGRIGRCVFRILSERPDLEVVAINDLYDNEQLAYLLRYDTVMGRFDKAVRVTDSALWVAGEKVEMTAEDRPEAIPWSDLGAELVVEATGVFRTRALLEGHLRAGGKKVVLTVPAKDSIDATIVLGVNEGELRPGHRLISNASCTTNCLAPLVNILDDSFGFEEGFLSTIHAYTNDQRLADVPHKNLRRSRAAAENIIPTTTGAAKAVGKVLPHLDGKLDGMAMRVPVPDGSIVDLVCRVRATPTTREINDAVRSAADQDRFRRIVEYSEVPLVSSDIIGNPHSTVFDSLSTASLGDGWMQVVAWYDNEWGYSSRVADLLTLLAGHLDSSK